MTFYAASGLDARAYEKSSGLAVDNSEAIGALTNDGITEQDIREGLYDGAEVRSWLVHWTDTLWSHRIPVCLSLQEKTVWLRM